MEADHSMNLQAGQHKGTEGWFDWAYKGVDHSFPGNGGLECRDFLSVSQRCWESVAASIVAVIALVVAYPRLRLPWPCPCLYQRRREPLGKRLLLLLMCLTFGIELGFKLATRQMIWIGNPCHLATMMQIFILAAPPSRIVTAAFRLHMHMLTGAPIAILFPVINTRLLPFETAVYFLQHILMLVIPFYLMKTGDPFIPEKLRDFSWSMISFGFLFIYHFLPLQLLAYVSQVNLNNMLCPAVSDPFHGKFYRLFAICHQFILIPTLGKVFVILARAFRILPCDNPPDEACVTEVFCCESGYSCVTNTCCSSNASQHSGMNEHTSEGDSGFAGSNTASCTRARGAPCPSCKPRCCCSPDSCTCMDGCRRCGTSSSGSSIDDIMSVQRIVNGQVVEDSGADKSCRRRAGKDGWNACQNSHRPQGFLLHNSLSQSLQQHDEGFDKPLLVTDLQKERNGHTKLH